MNVASAHHITVSLKAYLLPALKYKFGDKCANCGKTENDYQKDHKRYGKDITMYDLQLLCEQCHNEKTDIGNSEYISKMPHCSSCMCYA